MSVVNKSVDVFWHASETALHATQASMVLENRTIPAGYERSENTQRTLAALRKERGWV